MWGSSGRLLNKAYSVPPEGLETSPSRSGAQRPQSKNLRARHPPSCPSLGEGQ